MEPLELLAKLSALVPAPRAHLVRYSGVLAPASKWRPLIVPEPAILSTIPPDTADATQRSRTDSTATPAATAQEALQPGPCRHGRNYTWAELMKRVWELDVLECPRCRGRMKIVAAIHSPNAIQKILNCLGLPSRAPPIAAAARTSSDPLDDPHVVVSHPPANTSQSHFGATATLVAKMNRFPSLKFQR